LGQYSRKELAEWPSKGGVRPQSFVSYYDNRDILHRNGLPIVKDEETGNHLAVSLRVKHLIEKLSIPVRIGNFHGKLGVVEEFFCDILPHANHTCTKVKMESENVRENSSRSKEAIELDLFAVAAKESGLLHPNIHF